MSIYYIYPRLCAMHFIIANIPEVLAISCNSDLHVSLTVMHSNLRFFNPAADLQATYAISSSRLQGRKEAQRGELLQGHTTRKWCCYMPYVSFPLHNRPTRWELLLSSYSSGDWSQRSQVTCPRSHSRYMAEPTFKSGCVLIKYFKRCAEAEPEPQPREP